MFTQAINENLMIKWLWKQKSVTPSFEKKWHDTNMKDVIKSFSKGAEMITVIHSYLAHSPLHDPTYEMTSDKYKLSIWKITSNKCQFLTGYHYDKMTMNDTILKIWNKPASYTLG